MKLSRNIAIIILIVINIAIDQISKVWIRANFELYEVKELIGKNFLIQYVENKGAFLGMWSDMNGFLRTLLLVLVPVGVLGYLIYYIVSNKNLDKLSTIALCCIAGGGMANIFDRIFRKEVTDFLFIDLGGIFKTGIFNFADMSVTFGLLILVYTWFISSKKNAKN